MLTLPLTLNYGAPVNWAHPLNRGLAAWWKVLPLRYGGRRWLDLAGTSHGLLTGMGASSATSGWGATTRAGGYGELRFDGVDDQIATGRPLSTFVTSTEASALCWMKPLGTPPTAGRVDLLNPVLGDLDGYFGIYQGISTGNGSVDRIWCFFYNTQNRVFGIPYTNGAWVHIGLVLSGGVLAGYANGIFIGSTGVGAGISSMTGLVTFGYATQPATLYNGLLDDVRFYTRGLTSTEVETLYQASVTTSPLLNYMALPFGATAAISLLRQMFQQAGA